MNEYRLRRRKVLEKMLPNSALLLFGSSLDLNAKEEEPRLQNSDLYYLSGCRESTMRLLLIKESKPRQIVFCVPPNDKRTLWHGALMGPPLAKKKLNVDEAYAVETMKSYLNDALKSLEVLYFPLGAGRDEILLNLVQRRVRRERAPALKLIHSDELLGDMRLIKDKSELELIKQATHISMDAHRRVMKKIPTLRYEYQAEAELLYHYRLHNAQSAFPPIVAAGRNSCVLHYMSNDCPIHQNDCLLVDSGAQYEHYAADITRTYPPRQPNDAFKKAHRAVLRALNAASKCAVLGVPFSALHQAAVKTLTQELIKLGVLNETFKQALVAESYKKYFPHLTSHWIGLDVHDSGSYEDQRLKAGMVFSLEPGLYFRPEDETVAPEWRGMGVRIEDTIIMTPQGAQNLSQVLSYDGEGALR